MYHGLAKARRNAIEWFGLNADFDLYGPGWESVRGGLNRKLARAVNRCYRGPLPAGPQAKIEALQRYRFCLCIENTRFPGYATEKIFEPMFAGAIPVYLGAPDIAGQVPPDSFVDVRQFPSWASLGKYLANLPEVEVQRMRAAGADFLASDAFESFRSGTQARLLVDALDQVSHGAA